MKGLFSKYFVFFREEREKLIVFSALVLVGWLSFEAGFLSGGSTASLPLVIEKPVATISDSGIVAGASSPSSGNDPVPLSAAAVGKRDCAFVGSKNSTLYHLPTCSSAKRIKQENVVCFVSAEDAAKKGYKPGCLK